MGRDAFRQALADACPPREGAIGYVCTYTPEELILAAGLHPVRLFPPGGPTGPADAYLQSFCCSFARGCLDAALRGRWDGLAGVVFPYTCDSLRAVSELWRCHLPTRHHLFLNLPVRVEGIAALAYAAREFERFRQWLEMVAGATVGTDALHAAVRLVGAVRERLAGSSLLGREFLEVAMGAQVMDRFTAAELLEGLAPKTPPPRPGVGVLLAGGALEDPAILDVFEEAGAGVVGDDLCVGSRYAVLGAAWGDSPPGGPVVALARAYLERVPCPTRHPPERRLQHLLARIAQRQARGVVFLLQKFCDSHAFDLPYLRSELSLRGIPSLLLEVEQGALARGQALTRLEAFLEIIGS